MSSDSIQLDFDFGQWCSVCDTAIPGLPDTTAMDQEEEIKVANSKRRSIGGAKKLDAPLGSRRKSSTKLHRPVLSSGLAGSKVSTSRNKSHTSLSSLGLAASTPVIPRPSSPKIKEEVKPVFNPPSSLYCSEECQRLDELRSRLALGLNLEPLLALTSKRSSTINYPSSSVNGGTDEMSKSMARRRSSGVSQSGSSMFSNGPDYFHHYHSTGAVNNNVTLDFSTRRSSRGSGESGGYSYKPSWRSKSDEEGDQASMLRRAQRGNSSTDSLHTADPSISSEDSHRMSSSHGRATALSSLRFMTPIESPPILGVTSSNPPHSTLDQPPPFLRSTTDFAVPTAPMNNGNNRIRNVEGTRKKKVVMVTDDRARETMDQLDMPPPSLIPVHHRPIRSASSASLRLMSSSFSNRSNYSNGGATMSTSVGSGWKAPQRTESTASLSGLMANGNFVFGSVGRDETPMSSSMNGTTPVVKMSRDIDRSSNVQSSSSHSHNPPSDSGSSSSSDRRRPLSNSSYSQSSRSPPSTSSLLLPEQSRSTSRKGRQRLVMTPSATAINDHSSSAISSSTSPDAKPSRISQGERERRGSSRHRSRRTILVEDSLENHSAGDVISEQGKFLDHVLSSSNLTNYNGGGMTRRSLSHSSKSRQDGIEIERNRRDSSLSDKRRSGEVRFDGSASSTRTSEITRSRNNLSYDRLPTYKALDIASSLTIGASSSEGGGGVVGAVVHKKKKLFYFDEAADPY